MSHLKTRVYTRNEGTTARAPVPNRRRAHARAPRAMVNAGTHAGARVRIDPTSAPRAPADVPGFDAANPRRSEPAAMLAAREVAARETVVAVERAKLLREDVVACYRAEGVNHLERCGARVRAYLDAIENVGAHRINAGERDR